MMYSYNNLNLKYFRKLFYKNNKKQMLMQIMVLETKNGIYMKMKSFFKDYKQEKMV